MEVGRRPAGLSYSVSVSTVREIEIATCGGYPLWQSLPSAFKLFELLPREYPDLDRLRIYPGKRTLELSPNRSTEILTFIDDMFTIHKAMGRLSGLRSLTISPAVLHPDVFRVIAAYLYLETLVIQSTSDGGPVYDEYDLDDTSFPALRHLELIYLDPYVIEKLCGLEPLLRRLEHAYITFGEGNNETWNFDGDRVESLYTLVEGCPKLTELEFNTGTHGNDILLISELVDLFRLRALRYLSLSGLDDSTEPTPGWNELFSVLPLVEELHLLHPIRYLELRHIATMLPRLYFLELSEPIPNPCALSVYISDREAEESMHSGSKYYDRYLYILWPNIVVEAWAPEYFVDDVGVDDDTDRINHELSRLRHSAVKIAAVVSLLSREYQI